MNYRAELWNMVVKRSREDAIDPGKAMEKILADLMVIAKVNGFDWQELTDGANKKGIK